MSVLAVAVLGSCKKDDDTPDTRAEMLVDTWNSTEIGIDTNANGVWDASERDPAAGNAVKITFSGDGTGTATYAVIGTPFAITWNLQNNDNDIRLISNVFGTPDTTIEHIVSFSIAEAIVRDESYSPAHYMTLKKQ